MLLLYPIPNRIATIVRIRFTFHYASTLSDFLSARTAITTIYIPLCFYFISSPSILTVSRRGIYIPLCFYFIRQQAFDQVSSAPIYIPLCFYFIVDQLCLRHHASHLHSTMLLLYLQRSKLHIRVKLDIYIPLCFYFIGNGYVYTKEEFGFTFHYASTLSVYPIRSISFWYIYIPLCFYFIAGCMQQIVRTL